jgi:hypothetical protein
MPSGGRSSSAARSKRRNALYTGRHNGALAQLGERRLCKPEVIGSIPIRSTLLAPLRGAPLRTASLSCSGIAGGLRSLSRDGVGRRRQSRRRQRTAAFGGSPNGSAQRCATSSVAELPLRAVGAVRHRLRRLVGREVDAPAFVLVVPAFIALHAAERKYEHVVVNRLFYCHSTRQERPSLRGRLAGVQTVTKTLEGRYGNGRLPLSAAAGVDDGSAEQQDEQSRTRHAERDR